MSFCNHIFIIIKLTLKSPESVLTKVMQIHENSCILNKIIEGNLSIIQTEKTEYTSFVAWGSLLVSLKAFCIDFFLLDYLAFYRL